MPPERSARNGSTASGDAAGAGAGSLSPTPLYLRRADGRGRFSGTTFSSEFARHGGHCLRSLHLAAAPACTRTAAAASCSCGAPRAIAAASPAPPAATATTHAAAAARKHALRRDSGIRLLLLLPSSLGAGGGPGGLSCWQQLMAEETGMLVDRSISGVWSRIASISRLFGGFL